MNAMQDALVKAGLVSREDAERTYRDSKVNDELNKTRFLAKRKTALLREIETIRKQSLSHAAMIETVNNLSDRYPDVFDQVATEMAWDINLGRR